MMSVLAVNSYGVGHIICPATDANCPGQGVLWGVSATIDKVGIWAGMSGSPVYDTHGALIGACCLWVARERRAPVDET